MEPDTRPPEDIAAQARLEAYLRGFGKILCRAEPLDALLALAEILKPALAAVPNDLDADSLIADIPNLDAERLGELMEFYGYLQDYDEPGIDEDRTVFHATGGVRCLVCLLILWVQGADLSPTFVHGLIDSVVASTRGVPATHPQARAMHAESMARLLERAGAVIPANDDGDRTFGLELVKSEPSASPWFAGESEAL